MLSLLKMTMTDPRLLETVLIVHGVSARINPVHHPLQLQLMRPVLRTTFHLLWRQIWRCRAQSTRCQCLHLLLRLWSFHGRSFYHDLAWLPMPIPFPWLSR